MESSDTSSSDDETFAEQADIALRQLENLKLDPYRFNNF